MSPSPGGVGRYAARLAVNLAELGVELAPVVARHSEAEVRAAWEEAGLAGEVPLPRRFALPRPLLYDSWHLLGWPPVVGEVSGMAAGKVAGMAAGKVAGKADLVHAPSLAVPPKGGKPLVVSIHDAGPWIWPRAFGWRGRWFHAAGARAAARRADLVLTGTRAAAAELEERLRLPAARIRVVPYGVDPPVRPDPGTLHRYRLKQGYVLWVGSLEPRKGVDTLVEAMSRLGAPLVLAGYAGWKTAAPTPQPFLRQLGRVTDAELQALYAGAAAFAFPSLHEGFGLPVLEAMAAGAPVVAADIPALREVAGDAALLVPPGDASAWCEALQAVLALGQVERANVVERGRLRAATFTWRATAERTLELYRQLV